jgi:transcriptional regulator with XRE-family HTH domain
MGRILNSREIGWKLRMMRQQAGLTQEQLSERIGVTAQQIQKYESGASKLNTYRLQQVARVFSVPEQAFFTDIDDVMPLAVTEQALIDSYRAIHNRDVQESILKITTHATKVSEE